MLNEDLRKELIVGAHQCWRDFFLVGTRLREQHSNPDLGQIRELREHMIRLTSAGERLAKLIRQLVESEGSEGTEGSERGLCGAEFAMLDLSMCCRRPRGHQGLHSCNPGGERRSRELAGAAGLQPATTGLEGRCSDAAELRPRQTDSSIAAGAIDMPAAPLDGAEVA